MKEYKIKNEETRMNKNLSKEQLNITRAIFLIDKKKVVSEYRPDVPYERIDFAKIVIDPDNQTEITIRNTIFECEMPKRKLMKKVVNSKL
jgi:hypothetical protein